MKVTVEVTFPCSEDDFNRLMQIRALAGGIYIADAQQRVAELAELAELTDSEELVLRTANGTDSETPLLDLMAKQGVGGKVNITQVCADYISKHPGVSVWNCAREVASLHNLPASQVRAILHSSSYSKKTSRRFDKVNNGLYIHI